MARRKNKKNNNNGGKGGKKNKNRKNKEEEEGETPQERKKRERRERLEAKKKRNKARYARDESHYSANFLKMVKQVGSLGLIIKDVASDGNCLFRAVSDQLYGDVSKHKEIRATVMDHVAENKDLYQWFVEDDEPFEDYVAYMREPRSWGGQIEIQAMSMVYGVNIIVHRLAEPRWTISNWPQETHTLHLSYHDQQHYASVRPKGCPDGPFEPIGTQTLVTGSAKKPNVKKPKLGEPTQDEQTVLHATGLPVESLELVRDTLHDFMGNVDATIDFLCVIKYQHDIPLDPTSAPDGTPAPAPAEPTNGGPSSSSSGPTTTTATTATVAEAADEAGEEEQPKKSKPLSKREKKRLKREQKRLKRLGKVPSPATPAEAGDESSGDNVLDFGDIGV